MRRYRLGLLLGIALTIIGGSYLYAHLTTSSSSAAIAPPDIPDPTAQIAFWEARVAEQPGITGYTYLAEAHLRAARISGDLDAYKRAELALEEALAINPDFRAARFQMAAVMFALHDFEQARHITEDLAAERRPPQGTFLLLSDIYLALGEYDLAEQVTDLQHQASPGPATLSRLALLADLHGDTAQAILLMEQASAEAEAGGELPENRAWFDYQTGYFFLKSGDPDQALIWFKRSGDLLPGYYLALAGTAAANTARGEFASAIAQYEELVAAAPQPAYLAALGDLYALQGDTGAANAQYETVEFIASLNDGAYDRQYTNFLLDHDRYVDEALHAARQDVRSRDDIAAWDTLAWALYKSEQFEDAEEAIARALRFGTADARLHYHAGMIQQALGNNTQARTHLERALAINPAFDPLQVPIAEAALARLS